MPGMSMLYRAESGCAGPFVFLVIYAENSL